ncbi:Arc family DNA binding domain-containing protein [Chitinivorax sp. PXF-14]|uniref:Arc family DNA binding domain-containing protein n=1 Tax=Chitinivorax sp. PXF-14 TaxID=3230488 RepID=UPI003466AD99
MSKGGKKGFALRVDASLLDWYERLAEAELRSVNAQIEYALRDFMRQRLGQRDELPPPALPDDEPG